jgi:hypothetical protein
MTDTTTLPADWTVIATRPRLSLGRDTLQWMEVEGGPVSIAEAHLLAASGRAVMANRHSADLVELVIRAVPHGWAANSGLTLSGG